MYRTVLVLTMTLTAVLLAGGVALAADRINCRDQPDGRCVGTDRDDVLVGTNKNETILGLGGADTIKGRNGSDTLVGGNGADRIVAARCGLPRGADVSSGRGNDDINVTSDCGDLAVIPPPDRVDCGPGVDTVRGAKRGDKIASDCERVIRD